MAKKQKKNEVIPKILIGVPILSWTHEFALSFLKFWTELMTFKQKGIKFHVGYEFKYRRPVHMAEEELAQLAIDSGCTHLLLMDDDIYDVKAQDLLTLLNADKDVIAGIMHTSGFPHSMCAFRRYDRNTKVADQPILKGPARLYEIPPEQRHGIQPVDLVPFCFTLIKTKVFKKLKKPWFTCNTQAPTDSWFADSILDKGFGYFAHFGVWLNHRGITQYNAQYHAQIHMINQQQKGKTDHIVQITPEEMRKHNAIMTERLKEAEKRAKEATLKSQQFYVKDGNKGKIARPLKENGNSRH